MCLVKLLLLYCTSRYLSSAFEAYLICINIQVGGRLGYSIRGTLQSQSKSFVDNQHNIRVLFLNFLEVHILSFIFFDAHQFSSI